MVLCTKIPTSTCEIDSSSKATYCQIHFENGRLFTDALKITEEGWAGGRKILLSKSRKKLGSCARSVHVKTLRRFPMTTYLKEREGYRLNKNDLKWYMTDSGGDMWLAISWLNHGGTNLLLSVKKASPLFPLPHSFHSPDAVVFLCKAPGHQMSGLKPPSLPRHTQRLTRIHVLWWQIPTVHVMPTAYVQFPIEGP